MFADSDLNPADGKKHFLHSLTSSSLDSALPSSGGRIPTESKQRTSGDMIENMAQKLCEYIALPLMLKEKK